MFSRHIVYTNCGERLLTRRKKIIRRESTRKDLGAKVLNHSREKYEGACRTEWREGSRDRCGSELCGLMIDRY